MALNPPFALDEVSSSAELASQVGGTYKDADGKEYILCKAAADIATAAKKVVVTALASAIPTYICNTTTTANDHLAVGVVRADIVAATTTSGTIDSGEYFFAQFSGHATMIAAAAVADGAVVGSSTTAGRIDDLGITAGVGAIGVALESGTTGNDIEVMLKGMR